MATHKIKDDLPAQLEVYIGGLILGQGRYAGQPFPLQAWQKKFLKGAFSQPGDASLSLARGGGKTSFCAGIACAAVDVDGPLVEPMAETILIASSFDQGLIAFRHMLHFLQPSFEKYGIGAHGRFRVQDSANRATIPDSQAGRDLIALASSVPLLIRPIFDQKASTFIEEGGVATYTHMSLRGLTVGATDQAAGWPEAVISEPEAAPEATLEEPPQEPRGLHIEQKQVLTWL